MSIINRPHYINTSLTESTLAMGTAPIKYNQIGVAALEAFQKKYETTFTEPIKIAVSTEQVILHKFNRLQNQLKKAYDFANESFESILVDGSFYHKYSNYDLGVLRMISDLIQLYVDLKDFTFSIYSRIEIIKKIQFELCSVNFFREELVNEFQEAIKAEVATISLAPDAKKKEAKALLDHLRHMNQGISEIQTGLNQILKPLSFAKVEANSVSLNNEIQKMIGQLVEEDKFLKTQVYTLQHSKPLSYWQGFLARRIVHRREAEVQRTACYLKDAEENNQEGRWKKLLRWSLYGLYHSQAIVDIIQIANRIYGYRNTGISDLRPEADLMSTACFAEKASELPETLQAKISLEINLLGNILKGFLPYTKGLAEQHPELAKYLKTELSIPLPSANGFLPAYPRQPVEVVLPICPSLEAHERRYLAMQVKSHYRATGQSLLELPHLLKLSPFTLPTRFRPGRTSRPTAYGSFAIAHANPSSPAPISGVSEKVHRTFLNQLNVQFTDNSQFLTDFYEREQLTWLDTFLNIKNNLTDLKTCAHLVGYASPSLSSASVSGTELEGGSTATMLGFLTSMVKDLAESLSSSHQTQQLNHFCCSQEMENAFLTLKIKDNPKCLKKIYQYLINSMQIVEALSSNNFLDFRNTVVSQIELLEINKSAFFPFYWKQQESGHQVAIEVTKCLKNKVHLRIYNSGSGLSYHTATYVDFKEKFMPFLEIVDVPIEKVSSYSFLQTIFGVQKVSQNQELNDLSAQDVYEGLLLGLGGKISSVKYSLSELIFPQYVGICALESIMLVIQNQFESPALFRRFRFWITFKSVHESFESKQALLKEESFRFFDDALKAIAAQAIELTNDATITAKELSFVRSTLDRMRQALIVQERKMTQLEMRRNQIRTSINFDFDYKQSPYALKSNPQIPFESIFERVELNSYIVTSYNSEGRKVIQLPRLGLTFKLIYKKEGLTASCLEFPGYVVYTETTLFTKLNNMPNCLILKGENADVKSRIIIILPRLKIKNYSNGAYQTDTLLDFNSKDDLEEGDSYFSYTLKANTIIPLAQHDDTKIAANLFLALIYFSEKAHLSYDKVESRYFHAKQILELVDMQISRQRQALSAQSIEICTWITMLDRQTHDCHPDAFAIQLKAGLLIMRNLQYFSNDIRQNKIYMQIKEKISLLFYKYLNHIHHIDQDIKLSLDEENEILNHLQDLEYIIFEDYQNFLNNKTSTELVDDSKDFITLNTIEPPEKTYQALFTKSWKGDSGFQWLEDLLHPPESLSKKNLLRAPPLLGQFLRFYEVIQGIRTLDIPASESKLEIERYSNLATEIIILFEEEFGIVLPVTISKEALFDEMEIALKIHVLSCINQNYGIWPSMVLLALFKRPTDFINSIEVKNKLKDIKQIISRLNNNHQINGVELKEIINEVNKPQNADLDAEYNMKLFHHLEIDIQNEIFTRTENILIQDNLGLSISIDTKGGESVQLSKERRKVKHTVHYSSEDFFQCLSLSGEFETTTLKEPIFDSYEISRLIQNNQIDNPHLRKKLNRFLEQLEEEIVDNSIQIEERKKRLLSLVNKRPSNHAFRTKRELNELMGSYKKSEMADLCHWFYEKEYSFFHYRNPALTKSEIDEIFISLQAFLFNATYLQQQKKIYQAGMLLNDFVVENQQEEKKESEKILNKFIEISAEKRVYDFKHYPDFLVYEFFNEQLISKNEYQAIIELMQPDRLISIFRSKEMGDLDTVALLKARLDADGTNLCILMLDETNFSEQIESLQEKAFKIFRKKTISLPIHWEKVTFENLETLYVHLNMVIKQRHFLIWQLSDVVKLYTQLNEYLKTNKITIDSPTVNTTEEELVRIKSTKMVIEKIFNLLLSHGIINSLMIPKMKINEDMLKAVFNKLRFIRPVENS